MKDVVILGASGFAKEILWLLEDNHEAARLTPEWNILGFVDRGLPVSQKINGYPVLGDDEWLCAQHGISVVCGIGEVDLRRKITMKLQEQNPSLQWPCIISRHAIVNRKTISMGKGCIICAGSILTTDITLGNFVTVNIDCTIGHESTLGDYVQLNPSVNISGLVTIASDVQIGTGVKVIPYVSIGSRSIIGAGATVTKDIPPNSVAVGMPAKAIKLR